MPVFSFNTGNQDYMDVSVVFSESNNSVFKVALALVCCTSFSVMADNKAAAAKASEQACHQKVSTPDDHAPSDGAWWERQAAIMGTDIHVEVWHQDQTVACSSIEKVLTEMRRIDAQMSPYLETSRLSLLNAEGANGFVIVGEELFALLTRSQAYSVLTGGAFDITYASAGRHYNYRKGQRPDDATRRNAVEAINYRHLELDYRKHAVKFLHPDVYVDLGGIAKGYAVDRAVQILKRQGINQGMVSAGGDSQIIGDRHGEPWVVGVKDPRNPRAEVVVLPLLDASVSTSGDYERFFIENGVRFHHIIDPSSGDSARQVRSVTVIGSESTAADALSTSVFVMGARRGIALINQLAGIDAIVVDAEGRMHMSDGLAAMQPPELSFSGARYE